MSELPKILIAGSGPGALEAALSLGNREHLACSVTLISPQLEFVYRPNMVMEPFGSAAPARYRVSDVIDGLEVTQYQGLIERVDPGERKAWSPEGDEFEYDSMIVATGTAAEYPMAEPAITVTAPGSTEKLKAVVAGVDSGEITRVVFVAGEAGRSWRLPVYELALLMADRGARGPRAQTLVTIVTPESHPLERFGQEHSRTVRALIDEVGIDLITDDHVLAFDGRTLSTGAGLQLDADAVISVPTLNGRAPAGVPTAHHGFISVDAHQRVLSENGEPIGGLYAIGDVTDFPFKQGGLASAQADAAAQAVAADAGLLSSPEPFEPLVEATLLTADHRVPLLARITGDVSESLPVEVSGPSKKIHSRLLSERLDQIRPLG